MEIQAERLSITSTTQADLPDLLKLWNDGRVMQWVGFPNGVGYDEARVADWLDWVERSPDRHHFTVRAPGIGFCGELYYAVDRPHSRAALDIKFRPEAQGQGLATQAFRSLIDHVFTVEKEVQAVFTDPHLNNKASQALYARCGLAPQPRPADLEPFESYWELSRAEWGSKAVAKDSIEV